MVETSIAEIFEGLSQLLSDYKGYTDPDDRKHSASTTVDGIAAKLAPAAALADSIGPKLAKVGKLDEFWFYGEIKKFSNDFADRYSMNDFDVAFFTSDYVEEAGANDISRCEFTVLTMIDELILFLKKVSGIESVDQLVAVTPKIKQHFEEIGNQLEIRKGLIEEEGSKFDKIEGEINAIDSQIESRIAVKPLSDLINSLLSRSSSKTVVFAKLLEVFHHNLSTYRQIAESAQGYNKPAIVYFDEYRRVCKLAENHLSMEVVPAFYKTKIEEQIKWAENIGEIAGKLDRRRSEIKEEVIQKPPAKKKWWKF